MFLILFFLIATHANGMEVTTYDQFVPTQQHDYFCPIKNDSINKLILLQLESVNGVVLNDGQVAIVTPKNTTTLQLLQQYVEKPIININDYIPSDDGKPKKILAFDSTKGVLHQTAVDCCFILYAQKGLCHGSNNLYALKLFYGCKNVPSTVTMTNAGTSNPISFTEDELKDANCCLYVHNPLKLDERTIFSILRTKGNQSGLNKMYLGVYNKEQDSYPYVNILTIDKNFIIENTFYNRNRPSNYYYHWDNQEIISNAFSILYNNQKTESGIDLKNNAVASDIEYDISIDDVDINGNKQKATLNAIIRFIFKKKLAHNNVIELTVYCLITTILNRSTTSSSTSCWKSDPKCTLVQIPTENGFYNSPVYFKKSSKPENQTTILPLRFNTMEDENPSAQNQELKCTFVKSYKDYFKQSTEQQTKREQCILNNIMQPPVKNNISNNNTLQPDDLPADLKKDFDTIQNCLQQNNPNSEANKALSTIIDAIKKMVITLKKTQETLDMIHNTSVKDEAARNQFVKNEIGVLKKEIDTIVKESTHTLISAEDKIKELKKELEQITNQLSQTVNTFKKEESNISQQLINTFLNTTEKSFENIKAQYSSALEKIEKQGERLKLINDATSTELKNTKIEYTKLVESINNLKNDLQDLYENEQGKIATTITTECTRLFNEEKNILTNEIADLKTKNKLLNSQITDLGKKITQLKSFNWRLNFCTTIAILYLILQIKGLIQKIKQGSLSIDSILSLAQFS